MREYSNFLFFLPTISKGMVVFTTLVGAVRPELAPRFVGRDVGLALLFNMIGFGLCLVDGGYASRCRSDEDIGVWQL